MNWLIRHYWLATAALVLLIPKGASADASAFSSVNIPGVCGSVCIPPMSAIDSGFMVGNTIETSSVLGQTDHAFAFINLTTGAAGTEVETDTGTAHAQASHFDTWFCPAPAACAALTVLDSFIPTVFQFHISGSASLTPEGGFMELQYTYDTNSLLGSTAGGRLDFDFFEDPGFGLHADIEARASFFDYHTNVNTNIPVIFAQSCFNCGQIAFSANATLTTFIGGCTAVPCDMSGGVFTDIQSLSAQIDHANNNTPQAVRSLNTFQVGLISDLPLTSADGRTAATAAAAPEPASFVLIGLSGAVGLLFRKFRNF